MPISDARPSEFTPPALFESKLEKPTDCRPGERATAAAPPPFTVHLVRLFCQRYLACERMARRRRAAERVGAAAARRRLPRPQAWRTSKASIEVHAELQNHPDIAFGVLQVHRQPDTDCQRQAGMDPLDAGDAVVSELAVLARFQAQGEVVDGPDDRTAEATLV